VKKKLLKNAQQHCFHPRSGLENSPQSKRQGFDWSGLLIWERQGIERGETGAKMDVGRLALTTQTYHQNGGLEKKRKLVPRKTCIGPRHRERNGSSRQRTWEIFALGNRKRVNRGTAEEKKRKGGKKVETKQDR